MSTTAPHVEDLLLDFAYGELSAKDARAVEEHLGGCAQCKASLDDIRGVRKVMSQLPEQGAPDAGLESLLAYAEQAARRTQAGPAPKPTWWRRWLVPASGLAALVAVGVIAHEVQKGAPTAQAVVEQALWEQAPQKAATAPMAGFGQEGYAAEEKAEPPAGPMAGAPPPPPPADEPRPAARERRAEVKKKAGPAGGLVEAQRQDAQRAPARKPSPTAVFSAQDSDRVDALLGHSGADKGGGGADLQGDLLGGGRLQAPGARGKSAPAAPAPAPRREPRRAAEMESMAKAEAADADAEAEERQLVVAAQKEARERAADTRSGKDAATAQELSRLAQAAHQRGDVAEEARLLRAAVALAPPERTLLGNLLLRLCDAEFNLGNDAAGERACQRAGSEFPGTSTAIAAKRRALEGRQRMLDSAAGETATPAQPAAAPPAERSPTAQ